MEDMIGDASGSGVPENLGIFLRLKHLYLFNLPNLRSINRRAWSFGLKFFNKKIIEMVLILNYWPI